MISMDIFRLCMLNGLSLIRICQNYIMLMKK